MGGVGGVQRREEEENAKNAFFLFSPPPPPPKRRRSSMSSFGSNFATMSSSSNLSSMKLTPRTGICATALARMRYMRSTLSLSLSLFFFLRDLCLKRVDLLLKNASALHKKQDARSDAEHATRGREDSRFAESERKGGEEDKDEDYEYYRCDDDNYEKY